MLKTLKDNKFDVIASEGDMHLGGEDFNQALLMYCKNKMLKESPGEKKAIEKAFQNDKTIRKFRAAVEQAKKELTTGFQSQIDVDATDELSIVDSLTRATFDEQCKDLHDRIKVVLDKTMMKAFGSKDVRKVHAVIAFGGSSRIPKIQANLKDYFK